MVRVLVTGIGGPAGSSLARQLRAQGHWVGGVDMDPAAAAFGDHFAQVPGAGDPGYLGILKTLAAEWGCELLIPTVSDELVAVAASADILGIPVLVGPADAVHTANDKYLTMQALAAAGVPVPGYGLPDGFASAQEAHASLGHELVAKPRVSRGGRGVHVLEAARAGEEDAVAFWDSLDESWILQTFAPGVEYAPVVFAAEPGEPAFIAVLEKTELKEGRVGNAVSVRPVDAPDVADLAGAVVAALGLSGPVDMDVRRLEDGTPVVLEVNARFGANSASAPGLLEAVLTSIGPAVDSPLV
ncbi:MULTISPECIES: ATP-grasp domain-containing protein [Arthrobacter]|uniref:ATP-grasp domain-containing protein n=2 Tax=Arthrobacter TaxID=1663 RepID=A0ABU9KHN6_9MICC|nr:ATP-grasp domain-containing protein [Arthrobacter sp. YJM1]MDP5226579.1 ATP-grasp domain-containing protein [Arthrobacter sp. YJM1]